MRHWVGNEAIKMARTPGPSGPGFELGLLQDIAASVPAQRNGGEIYMTRESSIRNKRISPLRDAPVYVDHWQWEWRIWDQSGRCHTMRLTDGGRA